MALLRSLLLILRLALYFPNLIYEIKNLINQLNFKNYRKN